jgi:hypothetical protein
MAASAIAPLSYICLVSGLVAIGASLNLVGQVLITPFALKNKAWDMIVLSVFFGAVNTITLAPHVAKAFSPDTATPSHLERVDRTVHAAPKLAGVRK